MRWTGSGRMHNDGRTILYSGHEEQHVQGVGMVLNRQATKALICWKPVSDRIIVTCFHLPQVKTTIVQVYAPIKDTDDDVKDAFYDQLQDMINDTPSHDVKLLVGNFNAQIDGNHQGLETSVIQVNCNCN